jgi:hypothetical protein
MLPETRTAPSWAVDLEPGADLRLRAFRREAFVRFYLFHLRYRAHPGAVYYLLPHLRHRHGWTEEEALWFAFLNGNTQNPVTSLLLHRWCWNPADDDRLEAMLDFYRRNYTRLAFDTDRRHWKSHLPEAVNSYVAALLPYGGSQARMWQAAASGGFSGVWELATALHGFGRLSAFSYAEYLRITGVPFDCDRLFLEDIDGSRSHRNGLAILTGHDDWVVDKQLGRPGATDAVYTADVITELQAEADAVLAETRRRAPLLYQGTVEPVGSRSWPEDIGYFTLESALCTYKSWHKPNRRYPNVYNDMLYDRLHKAERDWGDTVADPFWEARNRYLPRALRLEDSPYDPGCVPVKQNHYRETGQVPVIGHWDTALWSSFDTDVRGGRYGLRRDLLPGKRTSGRTVLR